jgi:hypothetical protein
MQLKLFILPVKNLDAAEAEMNAFLRSQGARTFLSAFVRAPAWEADKNVRAPLRGVDDL